MNPRTDHYTFLGLPMDAPSDGIALAWDRMQRQADAVEAKSPAQAEAIREKLRQVREDLLSGAQRREAYNRRILSARAPAPQEPTIVRPLRPPPPPPDTTIVAEPAPTPVTVSSSTSNRWLLPVAVLAALLIGAAAALAASRVLGGSHSAAIATATTAPTAAPTAAPTSAPTATSEPRPTATVAPTTPPTVAPAPTSPPPTTAPVADPGAQDTAVIKAKGYTPVQGHAETSDGSGGTLYAWRAVCTGSADGYCQKVFFFDGPRYLGTDTLNDSTAIMAVDAAGPATIAVKYANYQPNDPFCCPTGTPVSITYHWTGQRLIPSGTPPGHQP